MNERSHALFRFDLGANERYTLIPPRHVQTHIGTCARVMDECRHVLANSLPSGCWMGLSGPSPHAVHSTGGGVEAPLVFGAATPAVALPVASAPVPLIELPMLVSARRWWTDPPSAQLSRAAMTHTIRSLVVSLSTVCSFEHHVVRVHVIWTFEVTEQNRISQSALAHRARTQSRY